MSIQAVQDKAGVSVIIPCYRCAETIARAVDSILNQTLLPAELILVDDASGDGTLSVLQSISSAHPKLIKLIAFQENEGVSDARNAGWEAATQLYVAFLDADDAWHPKKIEIQYQFMTANPEIAMSGHAHRRLSAPNEQPNWPIGSWTVKPISKSGILVSNQFVTPSVMLKREILFRFSEGKRHMEDHLLWSQIICAGLPVVKLSAELAAIYKFAYGVSGLSAASWQMQQGEWKNYWQLGCTRRISKPLVFLLCFYSLLKYMRRVLISLWRHLLAQKNNQSN